VELTFALGNLHFVAGTLQLLDETDLAGDIKSGQAVRIKRATQLVLNKIVDFVHEIRGAYRES